MFFFKLQQILHFLPLPLDSEAFSFINLTLLHGTYSEWCYISDIGFLLLVFKNNLLKIHPFLILLLRPLLGSMEQFNLYVWDSSSIQSSLPGLFHLDEQLTEENIKMWKLRWILKCENVKNDTLWWMKHSLHQVLKMNTEFEILFAYDKVIQENFTKKLEQRICKQLIGRSYKCTL
jgi:hypothetical protein